MRNSEHAHGTDKQPEGDQIIDLDLRTVANPEQRLADDAVAGDTALATKKTREHQ